MVIFNSCNGKIESIGDINSVTIIASHKDREQSQHIVEYFFNNRYINTPQHETVYSINWLDPKDIKNGKFMKNILLLSLDYPSDSTIDVLANRIMSENNISDHIFSLQDVFAKKQKLVILKSIDTIDLEKKLSENFQWICSEYNENIYNGYYDYIIDKGENKELTTLLKEKMNISIFIQEDYKLIGLEKDFIWIGRGYPYRWLIFNKFTKKQFKNKINLYDLFRKILKNNNMDISIYDGYMRETKLIYNDESLDVYRGVYDHQGSQTGGPFALYLLDNNDDDEVILVASMINNPGNSKMPHLLQADALIKNIKILGD